MRFCCAKPLSHGLRRASPPSSGALGKEDKFLLYGQHADAAALPRPPLLGEVALRSKDGRVVQRRSLPVRQTLPSSTLGSPARQRPAGCKRSDADAGCRNPLAVAKRLRGSPPLQRGAFFMRILLPKVPNCGTRRKFWKNFGQNTEKISQFCPLWPMRSCGALWYP